MKILPSFQLLPALFTAVSVVACSGEYSGDPYEGEEDESSSDGSDFDLGVAQQAAAACQGDDVNYDFNAFAASLAVAVANELGRWNVVADFEVKSAKLELSATGELRCGSAGCANTRAILRLQDDASSIVPNHSPSLFRGKLTSWYGVQKQKLTELVDQTLVVDKGIYRLKVRHSNKYMAVKDSSTAEGAAIVQRSSVAQAGADQWRVILDHGKHRLVNVRSGKCLTLASDSSANGIGFQQKTCSTTSPAQQLNFALTNGYYWLMDKHRKSIDVQSMSQADDAPLTQFDWLSQNYNQAWTFEPYGSGPHVSPENAATAMYQLTFKHSGKSVAVAGGSMADGVYIEQRTYKSTDDAFHWYVLSVGNNKYQFVNRRSSKCLTLMTDTMLSYVTQRACNASDSTQLFTLNPTEDGTYLLLSKYNFPLEVPYMMMNDGAYLTQGPQQWDPNRRITLTPVIGGEPHRLTFSHKTSDARCGEFNYWYNIEKPNGQPLKDPRDTFVQLIFAGGKQTATGTDINPFIAQQVSGNLVAIDPTYGLNPDASSSTGTCSASCVKISTTNVGGQCCSCNGATKKFAKSPWSPVTFVCQ